MTVKCSINVRNSQKVQTKVPAVFELGVFRIIIIVTQQLNVFRRHAFIRYDQ